jgi:hypothetical protein
LVLIGGAPFIILILILISPFLVAKAFSTILARNGNLNISPRTKEGYELLVLSSQLLHFFAISGTLSCQLLDVGNESLYLPI